MSDKELKIGDLTIDAEFREKMKRFAEEGIFELYSTEKEEIKEVDENRNPPYDCPHYFSNWNSDDCCKLIDGDYCSYDEYNKCEDYNDIFGIKNEENEVKSEK